MGIRIHTVIGYGVKFAEPEMVPPRAEGFYDLTVSQVLRRHLGLPEEGEITTEMIFRGDDPGDELNVRMDLAFSEGGTWFGDEASDPPKKLSDHVHVVGHPDSPQLGWLVNGTTHELRYDDAFDYDAFDYQYFTTVKGQEDQMIPTVGPIYPYYSYVDAQTLERLNDTEMMKLRTRESIGAGKFLYPMELIEMGKILPEVPRSMAVMAMAAGLIAGPEEAQRVMRPYIAVWWS